MKAIIVAAGTLLVGVLWQSPAGAWMSANRYGGSTTHSWGETSHTNAWGGSTSHTYGAYGGSVSHTYVGGGGSVYHPPGNYAGGGGAAYHYGYGGYTAYHPPVAVPYYASSGCMGCAAAAGAIVGVAAGAAIASANTAAATSNAYSAGVAAGAAATYGMNVNYAALPSGCVTPTVGGATYYLCGGNTWFQPIYGANGVYYRVVPAP